jgi:Mg-chelatase subunit ChlD
VLNAVIVLDVSGSMGGSLNSKGEGNRLALAKEAILMFFSKLRKNDAFGLVIFNNSAKTLIPLQTVDGI